MSLSVPTSSFGLSDRDGVDSGAKDLGDVRGRVDADREDAQNRGAQLRQAQLGVAEDEEEEDEGQRGVADQVDVDRPDAAGDRDGRDTHGPDDDPDDEREHCAAGEDHQGVAERSSPEIGVAEDDVHAALPFMSVRRGRL